MTPRPPQARRTMGPAFPPRRRRGQWWSWVPPVPPAANPSGFPGVYTTQPRWTPSILQEGQTVARWSLLMGGKSGWEWLSEEAELSGFRSPAAWTKLAGEEIFYRVQILRRLLYWNYSSAPGSPQTTPFNAELITGHLSWAPVWSSKNSLLSFSIPSLFPSHDSWRTNFSSSTRCLPSLSF